MNNLEGKVAMLSGAGLGIGLATAQLLARRGASVVLSDIDQESVKKATEELIQNGMTAAYFKADTSSLEAHEAMMVFIMEKFGRLDIAVNNAGIGSKFEKTAEVSAQDWQKVIDINLTGVFYGMKTQIPAMMKSSGGSIVNIASILGQVGFLGAAAYIASKHGVVGLTKAGALDHASDKIRVNAIGPGFIYTGLVNEETMGKEAITDLEQKHALHRLGTPEEVAALCAFLASDEASFITGSYYPVDGGYLAM